MRAPVRLGLQLPRFDAPGVEPTGLLDHLTRIAAAAEQAGFDSLFVMDHLHQIPGVGEQQEWMLEGNTALAALAGRTERLNLGLMVGGVTYRNPALHAKITTTLDVLSGGRAIHGIGAAWFEDEHRAYGFEFPPLKERFVLLEEHLNVARAMFTEERTERGAYNNPRPIRGDIPILVGGSGERKTLRLVARYADGCNVFGAPDHFRHLMEVLDGHCADVGRDPKEITRTKLGTLAVAETHEAAEALLDDWPARKLLPPERLAGTLILGTPDEVAEQAAAFVDAGLEGLVVNMPNPYDLDAVALAGEALGRALPS